LLEAGKEKYGDGRFHPGNPVGTSLGVIKQVAEYYAEFNNLTIDAGDEWSLEKVSDHLDKDHPVMVNYGGCSQRGEQTGLGHSIVIYGINWDTKDILIVDPLFSSTSISFSKFESQWGKSDCGDPLQPGGHTKWGLTAYR